MKNQKDISVEFLKAIGKNVKEKRKERHLSLEKLGIEIGMSRSMVHRIEKGLNITVTTLLKLMIVLNTDCKDLLKFDHKLKKGDLEKLVGNSKGNKMRSKK